MRAADTPTRSPGHRFRPVDPGNNPHLRGPFEPIVTESDRTDLRVIGDLPVELNGSYLRNGPNPRFTPIGSYSYPIDGDAMVHRIRLTDGTATYSNRFVRTPALDLEEQRGRAVWPGVLSGAVPDPAAVDPELAYVTRDLPDINIVRHGGRILALAESANPFRLSPDLDTIGRELFDDALPAGITAHPKIDPVTGEMITFCYLMEAPYLTWSSIGPDGSVVQPPTTVPGVDAPFMIHDMALTTTTIVLFLAPLMLDMHAAVAGGSPLSWQPERGTRVALIPRDRGPVRWCTGDAFWLWHTANAFDDGSDRIVVDFVRHDHPGMGLSRSPNTTSLVRTTLDARSGGMHHTVVDDADIEFPRIDDRSIGGRHDRIAVCSASGRRPLPIGASDALYWYRTDHGERQSWVSDDLLLGEPTFAPRPGDPDPDHGWWMTFAIDSDATMSHFLVFAAADPAAGPIARIEIPVRVPLGLHGNWLPSED